MKLENDKDFKQAEALILNFKKVTLDGFTGQEAYILISHLEWLVSAMTDYRQSLVPKVAPAQPVTPSSITLPKREKKSK